MSDKGVKILAGVAFLSFGLWYRAVSLYRRIAFRVADVRFRNIVLGEQTEVATDITVQLYNPTLLSATIGQINVDVFFHDVLIGTITHEKSFVIASNGVTTLPLYTLLNASQFSTVVWDMIVSGNFTDLVVTAKGSAVVVGKKVTFTYDYNLNNRQ